MHIAEDIARAANNMIDRGADPSAVATAMVAIASSALATISGPRAAADYLRTKATELDRLH